MPKTFSNASALPLSQRHPMKSLALLLVAFFATPAFAAVEITADGPAVTVAPGTTQIGGETVTVAQRAALAIDPAPILTVSGEALKLSTDAPAGWAKGTRLAA